MTPRRFFYLRVVIDFYQTMTSRGERHPIALHFTIDGHKGLLRAADIAAAFKFLVALSNSVNFRKWPYPSPGDIVWVLSRNTCAKLILFRRQLPSKILFVDHVPWSNLFPLQYVIQRGGSILEALFRFSKGFWFGPKDLIMTSLFYFEEKTHRNNINRVEAIPLLLSRPHSHVLEHLGFPAE